MLVIDVNGENNAWLSDENNKLANLDVASLSLTPHGGSCGTTDRLATSRGLLMNVEEVQRRL